MIKAIIVESEVGEAELLRSLLNIHYLDIEVVCLCKTENEALAAIQKYEPKLIFLDMEIPGMHPFEFLDKIKPFAAETILTSEHDKQAIEAIHNGVVDLLLKPVNSHDLKKAVDKAKERLEIKFQHTLVPLFERLQQNLGLIQNVALPTIEGLQMVPVRSIIYCASNSNYTNFSLKNKLKLHVCRTLKQVESMLDGHHFIRVHHSYLVNINEVKKYIKGEGGSLVMSDNTNLSVSRSHKEVLLKKLQNGKY